MDSSLGGAMKKSKRKSTLWQELRRDWNTMKRLSGKKKLRFFWDYYKWPAIACAFSIFVVCLFAHMLWESRKPCRLRVCAVLNTEDDCSLWFRQFAQELSADGKPGTVELNQDQPFDYDNRYYYMHEIEVMTTISSGRMDFAICGEDMYTYLLALNACLPLDQGLSEELVSHLNDCERLVFGTANLQLKEDGTIHEDEGIEGYYAVNLSQTPFSQAYNRPGEGKAEEPLYGVVISNTEHLEDCEALLWALTGTVPSEISIKDEF